MPSAKEILDAATVGDLPRLAAFLAEAPEVAGHWQPLLAACLHGRVDAVHVLLDAGADPNVVSASSDRFRPLHRAIEHRGVPLNSGHRAVVELLLERGADPEARACWQRMTALGTAGRVGDTALSDVLRSHGADVNIYTAAVNAWPKEVAAALQADSQAVFVPDENGMTALHYAASSGLGNGDQIAAARLQSIAELLLRHGADPNAVADVGPYKGLSVLHFSARENGGVLRALLANGADARAGFCSFLWGEPNELADLLLAHGADPNYWDDGQPLLHSRIHWGHAAAAIWLVEHGADSNQRDKQSRTALHVAAARGNSLKTGEALLAAGAELDARDEAGRTPLAVAEENGRTKFAQWLRSRGARE